MSVTVSHGEIHEFIMTVCDDEDEFALLFKMKKNLFEFFLFVHVSGRFLCDLFKEIPPL